MGRIGNIINRKGKQDAKKAKEFTKLGRQIIVAVKEGGKDLEYNAALKTAVEKAKAANMPVDNINRAIAKGAGELGNVEYTEMHYEGYGPSGIAILVEVLTDNMNRTAADVRSYFVKGKGNLGVNGCVSYLFDKKGVLAIRKPDSLDEDEFILQALELAAEDVSFEEDIIEVLTDPTDFASVRDGLSEMGYEFEMAEIRYLPDNLTELESDEDIKNMEKLLDLLENNDDVQNVYHNWIG